MSQNGQINFIIIASLDFLMLMDEKLFEKLKFAISNDRKDVLSFTC
jgi:hypothetical protein